MEIKILTDTVTCKPVGERLLCPEVFLDSPNLDALIEAANRFLASLPPDATAYPWIVGSTDRDYKGNPRTSPSHTSGQAIDISPMFDDVQAIPPTESISGLAWNVASLMLIGQSTYTANPWAVEGDHIHIVLGPNGAQRPVGRVICVPTIAEVYSLAEYAKTSPALENFFRSAFLFSNDPVTYVVMQPEQVRSMAEYLKTNHPV